MVPATSNKYDHLTRSKYCILLKGYIPDFTDELWPYPSVFGEFSVVWQMVLRDNYIVLSKTLQTDNIVPAH